MRLSLLPIWYIFRQHCLEEYFVTDKANNPPGLSKTILGLESPEQITLRKQQHLYKWSGLRIFKVMNTEPQLKFLYLLFLSSLRATSQLPDSQKKRSTVSLETLLHLGNHISHLLLSFRPQQNWSMFSIHYQPSFLLSPSLYPLGFMNPISSCCLEPTTGGTTLVCSHYIPAIASCTFILHSLPVIMYFIPLNMQQKCFAPNSEILIRGDLGWYRI